MIATVSPGTFSGKLPAIPSKSHLHRLLICAALADKDTVLLLGSVATENLSKSVSDSDHRIAHPPLANDIKATISCLSALGAHIEHIPGGLAVRPLRLDKLPETCILPCMDSGSTFRFMLPLVCALGVSGEFHLAGRLPERPLAPLDTELTRHGIELWRPAPDILCCRGKLHSAHYTLPGNVSSQYISGLLMALPLLDGDSVLHIEGDVESEGYIDMTLKVNATFAQHPKLDGSDYIICGTHNGNPFVSPGRINAEGDWSNGAFWLCAGAMPGGNVELCGLNLDSTQGDRAVYEILTQMGARISAEDNSITVSSHKHNAVEIDARAIPDLIPVLSAVAAVGEGITIVRNAQRLRLKESDRLMTTAQILNTLGAKVTEIGDELHIEGVPRLVGGTVDAHGDHRIAMTAAIASAVCDSPVIITGAEAVNKSYPQFWEKLSVLGKNVEVE